MKFVFVSGLVRPVYGMRRKTYARICKRIKRLERTLVGSRIVRHATLHDTR